MVSFESTLRNERGLHARAAAKLVRLLESNPCTVFVSAKGKRVQAVSIIELLLLGARLGDAVRVDCEGEGAQETAAAIKRLIENKFNEEE